VKYIVVKTKGYEIAVLFPGTQQHWVVAAGFIAEGHRIVSAGFVRIRGRRADDGTDDTLKVECYGRSQGLELEARPDRDASLIQMCLHLPD
jgi:hypothetical protein